MVPLALILVLQAAFTGNSVAWADELPGSGMPPIGEWLIAKDGSVAHWLGQRLAGKMLLEPINVIVRDRFSQSSSDAIRKLMGECKKSGYEEEIGHSSGYRGSIDGKIYPQIPDNRKMAFSDKEFFQVNNHGRLFGPARWNDEYVFTGAFSRESFKLFNRIHHTYLSFNAARDDFCRKLESGGKYKRIGNFSLNNVADSNEATTGDHDGFAAVLEAQG